MTVNVTTAAIATIGLPFGVLVACTRTDKIKVLAHINRHGKLGKEFVVNASFRQMLKKGIITACSEVPKNIKHLYPDEAPKVEA
jgi:hypothetical protein